MELYQLYTPITATPFQQNEDYQEFEPCSALKPYIRCFWGTNEPIMKKASNVSTLEIVTPDTCMDIIYTVDFTHNKMNNTFCRIDILKIEILQSSIQHEEDTQMIESRCGIICRECRFTECKGCTYIDNPFWGNCGVKACCEQKEHTYCGECAKFPCDLLTSFAYDEKEGDDGKRIEQCKKWKMNIKFQVPLLAVKDVEVSKQFYKDIFGQEVVLDLGANVTFSGGFAIQQNFANLTSVSSDSVIVKSNNMELYFEVEDFDLFLFRLEQYPQIELVHPPKKHAWQQRVVRIYDPDWHMIEIGESMESIAKRYLAEGLSVEKVSEIIQHPIEFVEKCNS